MRIIINHSDRDSLYIQSLARVLVKDEKLTVIIILNKLLIYGEPEDILNKTYLVVSRNPIAQHLVQQLISSSDVFANTSATVKIID
jgi:hypothetical protein